MIRSLLLLVGMLTTRKPWQQAVRSVPGEAYRPGPGEAYRPGPGEAYRPGPGSLDGDRGGAADGRTWPDLPGPLPPWDPRAAGNGRWAPGGRRGWPGRRRLGPWVKWTAALVVVGLIFRRAITSVVLAALSASLHLVGINVHLPSVRFAWPWQTISAGRTTNTDLGPWVLQKIEGISRPALGQANFSFVFTHKVSKNFGPWPCWYASTFYAVGHAAATVDLNPGPAWWTEASGHYRLQVLRPAQGGRRGQVAVTMVLPMPQLPQTVHDVTIDNVPSKPVATQHSWTYPGLGCGVVLRPQFPQSVLYAQAQQIAYYKSRHAPQITHSLLVTAQVQATRTIRDDFIQPTVNAFGYTLDRFTLRWAAAP